MAYKQIKLLCLTFIILFGVVLSENEDPESEELNNDEDPDQDTSEINEKKKDLLNNNNKFSCTDFNINDFIEIDQNPDFNWTKRLFDYNKESKSKFPYALKESLRLHNLRFMNPTALWIESENGYLALSRYTNYLNSKIYATFLDEYWIEKNSSTSLGSVDLPFFFPVPDEISFYYPEDIQPFTIGDKTFAKYILKESSESNSLWLFSFESGKNYKIKATNDKSITNWKNWSPLVLENEYPMFYDTKSSNVLNCSNYEVGCLLIIQNFKLFPKIYPGTPYTRYKETNYYISFNLIEKNIYSNVSIFDTKQIFRPIFTILRSDSIKGSSSLKLVYASNFFDFTNKFFTPKIKAADSLFDANHHIQYLRIVSIGKWDFNNDLVDLVVHFIDRVNLAVPIKGLATVVDRVIMADSKEQLNFNETCITAAMNNYLDGTEGFVWAYKRKIKKRNTVKKKSRKEKRDERKARRQMQRKLEL